MIGLTIKHMRYFEALARHAHFGRAASACGITQPALSQQMKDLEEMVGGPLVERGAKSLRLTPLGEALLERVRAILLSIDELEDVVRASKDSFTGRLRLGVIPTIGPYILPNVIQALSSHFPAIDIQIRESVTKHLIRDLVDAQLDVAILALPISEPSLRELALFEEDFVLVRSRAEADLPVPSAKSLRTMKLLLLEEGHCFRDQALAFCDPSTTNARQVMEGSSLSTLVQMVGAGMGVTLIPEMALDLETRQADVSIARFCEAIPSRTIGMVWRKTNPLACQLAEMGAIIQAVGNSSGAPKPGMALPK